MWSMAGTTKRDDRGIPAFHQLGFQLRRASGQAIEALGGRLTEHRLPGLGELLQPLAQVHRVADERVLDALLAAEQGGGDPPVLSPMPSPNGAAPRRATPR